VSSFKNRGRQKGCQGRQSGRQFLRMGVFECRNKFKREAETVQGGAGRLAGPDRGNKKARHSGRAQERCQSRWLNQGLTPWEETDRFHRYRERESGRQHRA
jgi:hypothetical protein